MIHGDEGSLFLAHIMGIGKTTQVIAVIVLQHRFNMMWEEIEAKPHMHSSGPNNLHCPSNAAMYARYGFDCPCSSLSPTHFIKKHLGLNLILVPLGLLNTWQKEFRQCQPRLPRGKSGEPGKLIELFVAHSDNKNEAADFMRFAPRLRGKVCKMNHIEELHDGTQKILPGKSICVPTLQNGEVIILTTVDSVATHVYSKLYTQPQLMPACIPMPDYIPSRGKNQGKLMPQNPRSWTVPGSSQCFFSLIAKDEIQLRRTSSHAAILAAQNSQAHVDLACEDEKAPFLQQHIALMLLSGTPMNAGPTELACYTELMRRREWEEHTVLRDWRSQEMAEYGKEWDDLMRKKANMCDKQTALTKIVHAITPLIESLFLRVTTESKLLDEPVILVPKVVWLEDLTVKHPGKWNDVANNIAEEELEAFKKREEARRKEYIRIHHTQDGYTPLKLTRNVYQKSRIAATLPNLALLATQKQLNLSQSEWDKEKYSWGDSKGSEQKNPYVSCIDETLSSSGKLKAIGVMLDHFDKTLGKEKSKHLFLSAFHTSAYHLKEVRSFCSICNC